MLNSYGQSNNLSDCILFLFHTDIHGFFSFFFAKLHSTVRMWDINKQQKHKNIIKTKSTGGRKTVATACTYSNDGRYVVAGCNDGSIQLWDHNKHSFVSFASLYLNIIFSI